MVKCYSVLYSIVEESNTLFTDKRPSFEALNWISGVCEMIDTVAKAYDGVYYDVSVNSETLEITISLECGCVTVDGFEKPNLLYEAIAASKSVTFSHGKKEDNIVISFLFDGVWEDIG